MRIKKIFIAIFCRNTELEDVRIATHEMPREQWLLNQDFEKWR
jgi:hypothetical protein